MGSKYFYLTPFIISLIFDGKILAQSGIIYSKDTVYETEILGYPDTLTISSSLGGLATIDSISIFVPDSMKKYVGGEMRISTAQNSNFQVFPINPRTVSWAIPLKIWNFQFEDCFACPVSQAPKIASSAQVSALSNVDVDLRLFIRRQIKVIKVKSRYMIPTSIAPLDLDNKSLSIYSKKYFINGRIFEPQNKPLEQMNFWLSRP